jgi:AraC family transcriptional regulator
MNDSKLTTPTETQLAEPRVEKRGPLLVTGIRETLNENFAVEIPKLWQSYMQLRSQIANSFGSTNYGLCTQETADSKEIYYMACCEVTEFASRPQQMSQAIIPSQTYAVFKHDLPVWQLNQTVCAIFDKWLPASGYQLVTHTTHPIHHIEKYSEEFNPETGMGGMEVWVPVVAE